MATKKAYHRLWQEPEPSIIESMLNKTLALGSLPMRPFENQKVTSIRRTESIREAVARAARQARTKITS